MGETKVAQDDVLTLAHLAGRNADQIGTMDAGIRRGKMNMNKKSIINISLAFLLPYPLHFVPI